MSSGEPSVRYLVYFPDVTHDSLPQNMSVLKDQKADEGKGVLK
jgi:hypothetical protein